MVLADRYVIVDYSYIIKIVLYILNTCSVGDDNLEEAVITLNETDYDGADLIENMNVNRGSCVGLLYVRKGKVVTLI